MTMLQAFLAQLGYNPGPNDGLWGPSTQAAWLKFSVDNGLDPQVMVPHVWGAIDAGITDRYQAGPGGTATILEQFGADGGTGITITNSPGETSSGPGDGTIDSAEEQEIRDTFPTLAYLLDDPEIGPLLRRAVSEGWPAGKLSAQIEATAWFQSTSENQRLFDASIARDPATVQAQLDQQALALENTFSAYGITITSEELQDLAFTILRDGLDSNQQLRIIGNMARTMSQGTGGELVGNLGATVQQLRQMSTDYYLDYSDDELEEMAIRITEGRWTFDGAQASMKTMASSLYPHLAARIEEGMTLRDFYAPVKSKIASVLNMNPNDIDFADSRWAPLTQLVDDGKGGQRSMSFTEIQRWGRQQPEFWDTDQAAAEGYGVAHTLLQTMGAI